MTAAAPVIQCENLRKVYSEGTAAEVVALRGVSFRIAFSVLFSKIQVFREFYEFYEFYEF
jgi:hypothetical protein